MNLMKTSLFALTAVIATTASANVYMGVGAGLTHGKTKLALTGKDFARTNVDSKSNMQNNGFIGDLHVGHIDHIDATSFWTQQLAIAFDTAKPKKVTRINTLDYRFKTTRNYAATAKLGYGMKIDPVWSVAVNAGLAQSSISLETTNIFDKFSKNKNVWGVAAGAGVYKSFETYTLGVDYEYTQYQTFKKQQGNMLYKAKSPQYHTVMVKFSKTF